MKADDDATTLSGCRTAFCDDRLPTGASPTKALRFERDWNIYQALEWIVFRGSPTRYAVAQAFADALVEINNAVGQDLLAAWARPSDTWDEPAAHRPRQQIPSEIIDERRRIDVFGWYRLRIDGLIVDASGECRPRTDGLDFDWLNDPGPFFYDVCFRILEVKKLWPLDALPVVPALDEAGWIDEEEVAKPTARLSIRHRPGPPKVKMIAAAAAMVRAVVEKRLTYDALSEMKQKALIALYPASRSTLVQAREMALTQLDDPKHNSNITPTNNK